MVSIIQNLPKRHKHVALERSKIQYNRSNPMAGGRVNTQTPIVEAFPWDNTPEGYDFWHQCAEGLGDVPTDAENSKYKEYLPRLPCFNQQSFRPTYLGWAKFDEILLGAESSDLWSGIVYIYEPTKGPHSYYIKGVNKPFKHHQQYWKDSIVGDIEVIKKI